jgi:glyoxylase-like metal-dependent hydrolase (beta-lactamase superfamily II)
MPLLLRAGNASAWTGPTGNNTWLLRGRVPTLIDAGVGHPSHLDALAHALDGMPLSLVLITHGHVDHASGAAAIRARWPSVRVRQFCGEHAFVDGEQITAGDTRLEVLHTPGHSVDHCCFRLEPSSEIFCGDLLRDGGTVVIPASKGGSLSDYLASLRRIEAARPPRLLPAHGPVIGDPEALIDEYLRHRLERDAQILQAVSGGCRTPVEIVREVYRGLPQGLVSAAEDTVLAHLIKLKGEGRLMESKGGWRQPG